MASKQNHDPQVIETRGPEMKRFVGVGVLSFFIQAEGGNGCLTVLEAVKGNEVLPFRLRWKEDHE